MDCAIGFGNKRCRIGGFGNRFGNKHCLMPGARNIDQGQVVKGGKHPNLVYNFGPLESGPAQERGTSGADPVELPGDLYGAGRSEIK